MSQLTCPLRNIAIQDPKAIACLSDVHGEISYLQLDQAVADYANELQQYGFNRGQRLAWQGQNSLALIIAILACLRQGLIIAPLNHRLPLSRQQHLLRSIAANGIICANGADDAAGTNSTDDSAPHAQPDSIAIIPPPKLANNISDTTPAQPQRELELAADAPMDLIFTSGSSGTPKAVAHSLANHLASAAASQQLIPLKRSDRWLLSLPLAHIGGMAILFRCLHAGATMVLAEQSDILDAISRQQVTHLSLVSTQLYRLLEQADSDSLTHLKYLLLGGSAIDQSLLDRAKQHRLNCFTSYGMTEMSSQICTGPAVGDNIVGQPLPETQLRLSDSGEVEVKGSTLALGYWRAGKLFPLGNAQGWFATGDIAKQTAQGIRLIGRKDNRFVCGGENIVPEQIEQLLLQHSEIEQAVIVAVADEEWGHCPIAYTNPLSPQQQQALTKEIRHKLGSLWCPHGWLPLPAQPIDTKPDRQSLKQQAATICLKRCSSR
ncbi:o-succinylbenzoate--CoA ligase [Corallincola spongiicola]|uniref:O-succinylbenzoate--CoA ligase n=1 Tax=Corallincola spongiicola TaxID=2520508 RepID=A0ABY1WNA4_9GAMM|nr:o-succinylbenzoate--CoA ligase [Corallincola spongiicola]TAA45041.1 o-succinylbenzoate--CoA ligase [Corallincola spongiicola]